MLKIFRKIIRGQLFENKTNSSSSPVGKYLLYAVGEIILVVFGILIALQINNWNTRRIEKINEKKSYENIRRQVAEDMDELSSVKNANSYFSYQYELANQIVSSNDFRKIDTLAFLAMNLSQYSDFHRGGKIYETIVNSGEIRLLKNSEITSMLQRLEMTYTYINKLEDIHWEIIINELSPELKGVINYSNMQIIKPEKLFSVEIQNIIIESIYLTKGKDSIYTKALDEIETILELIGEELDK
ncbi:MAG: hypothetical protein HQ541_10840 [Mariniphaga sp.]|nr:hypothetical protein [Mariniphaga sp.]